MKTFKELGVNKSFIKGLTELNIINPTEIQEQVIPMLLNYNTDLVGQAQTGTGKTAAFGLPLLQKMDASKDYIQGVILAPTRELGQQIAKQLFKFTKYSDKIFIEAIFGGQHIDIQIKNLKRPTHIVVATPGRLIDLVRRKDIDLRKVHTVVMDEADEMLSMGFKKELDEILGFMTSVQSKWLFSATLPEGIKQIVNTHMSPEAKKINVSKDVVNTFGSCWIGYNINWFNTVSRTFCFISLLVPSSMLSTMIDPRRGNTVLKRILFCSTNHI